MKMGDRVRVRRDGIVFQIEREQFGSFGRKIEMKSQMTGRMMPLTVWYTPDELEVIE